MWEKKLSDDFYYVDDNHGVSRWQVLESETDTSLLFVQLKAVNKKYILILRLIKDVQFGYNVQYFCKHLFSEVGEYKKFTEKQLDNFAYYFYNDKRKNNKILSNR